MTIVKGCACAAYPSAGIAIDYILDAVPVRVSAIFGEARTHNQEGRRRVIFRADPTDALGGT